MVSARTNKNGAQRPQRVEQLVRVRDKKEKPLGSVTVTVETKGSVMVSVQPNKNRPQRPQRVAEQLGKEEGKMSTDNKELCEQLKEVKWREWCEEVMVNETKTLKSLNKLQTTSAILAQQKVVSKIRTYLQIIGRRIDQIVLDYEEYRRKRDRMRMRLWNYVSTFSNLSGQRLGQIYSKLKQEQEEDAASFGSSHAKGAAYGSADEDGNISH